MRVTALGILTILGLTAAATPGTAAPVACGLASDTASEFSSLADGCFQGDKLYTYVDGTLATALPTLELSWNGGDTPNDIHQLFIGGNQTPIYSSGDGNQNYTFSYAISVLDPTRFLTSVDLDVTQSAQDGSTTVAKAVYDQSSTLLGTLTSLNGAAIAPLSVNHQYLLIRETFSKSGNAIMNSAQNTYTQNFVVVPEPASVALFGFGLLAVSLRARRRIVG